MAGKFEIKSGKTGKFRFNLKASNGQIILTSEAYDTRSAATKWRRNCGSADVPSGDAACRRRERGRAPTCCSWIPPGN